MCSNFGLNLHPGRKPCALQWQWYNLAMRTFERVRRRFFPRALYMQREDGRLRAETRESERPPRDGR
jgi:hypothetical protein